MSYLDDSHFPGSQRVLRAGAFYVYYFWLARFIRNTPPRQYFQTMATNITPATSGETYASLPPLTGLSLQPHAGNCSQSRYAAPSSRSGPVDSSRNPVGMSVAHADHYDCDPFSHNYHHWPTDPPDWETAVFQVFGSFQNNDPRLWTPLTTPEERAQAFRGYKGRCLNCHGTDHSFKHCVNAFTSVSGCLNPQLGQPGDNGDAHRRW